VECLDDVCRIYEHEKQIMDNTGMSPIQDTWSSTKSKKRRRKSSPRLRTMVLTT
jgi:hypothetical protein